MKLLRGETRLGSNHKLNTHITFDHRQASTVCHNRETPHIRDATRHLSWVDSILPQVCYAPTIGLCLTLCNSALVQVQMLAHFSHYLSAAVYLPLESLTLSVKGAQTLFYCLCALLLTRSIFASWDSPAYVHYLSGYFNNFHAARKT